MSGPLTGFKAVIFAGIGPGPFCAMLLKDMGAQVVRIDPPASRGGPIGVPDERFDVLGRGQVGVTLDMKSESDKAVAEALIRAADMLVEGNRPGVMERLGLGPDECLAMNPGLVYGRVTGWGQDGPLAQTAGHDINYIALSGALHAMSWAGAPPTPPLNIVGDYAGGGLLLAFGLLAALAERSRSGKGQVVSTAMTDGASLLLSQYFGWKAAGLLDGPAGSNLVDGGPHFYGVYACADGRHVAVGAMEPQFYAQLISGLGLDPALAGSQYDPSTWAARRREFAAIFRSRTRDEWRTVFDGSDACVTPVLDMDEAPRDPHSVARSAFIERHGVVQPAPAPRFGRTPAAVGGEADAVERQRLFAGWGLTQEQIERILATK